MVAERNGVPVLVRHIATLNVGSVPRQGVIGQDDDIGSETQKPLAVVVIGGLISATLLTLIVPPTLYLVFSGRTQPARSGSPAAAGDTQVS